MVATLDLGYDFRRPCAVAVPYQLPPLPPHPPPHTHTPGEALLGKASDAGHLLRLCVFERRLSSVTGAVATGEEPSNSRFCVQVLSG